MIDTNKLIERIKAEIEKCDKNNCTDAVNALTWILIAVEDGSLKQEVEE